MVAGPEKTSIKEASAPGGPSTLRPQGSPPARLSAAHRSNASSAMLDASELERGVGDGEVEMLGHLALTQHGADLQTDRILAVQGFALTLHGGLDADQIILGRRGSSLRLRRRSPARSGLLHTILAGTSGDVSSAISRSSNSDICRGPPSSASLRIAGARVIQSSPAGFRSSSIRALVIMPRALISPRGAER
jgi:hypothetical protein